MSNDFAITGLEIAIVGMAGRFPGAADVDTFWRNIRDGVESISRYSDDELRARGVSEELLADPHYVKAGITLDGVDLFDAEFFGYTPRDAEQLDPQHRIFLECAWEALEHAGYDPHRHEGAIGVYAGAGANVYLMRNLLTWHRLDENLGIADLLGLLSGNMADALATRVAYKLNLRGPAVTVQTACSTSLMAVHSACQSLLGYECDMALAGGVSLNLLQNGGYRHQAGAIFSPDGHCRAFDAKAAGTLLGSGAGIVVLKRLEDALRDGDSIHAVIKGSAANNDGSDKVGFTAPSVSGQAAVIRTAQTLGDTAADSIDYIEAHGTGTTLGDPIEVAALTQAFRAGTQRNGFCALGSVKTNIGHLDAAAGVAGLIKTTLALKHQTLPPSLHFERANPQIDFEHSPFFVNTGAKPWPVTATPRRAGVSAFGIGGTNVHVVLEQAPSVQPKTDVRAYQILLLSARNPIALRQMAQRLANHLQQTEPKLSLADVAYTLQRGRRAFEYRCAVVTASHAIAVESLQFEASALSQPSRAQASAPEVAFLFPGGGVQHANMGLALYRNEPVFRQEVDRCCEFLQQLTGADLRELLFPAMGAEAQADAALSQMNNAQPALFVIGYALAKLWMARGVQPTLMLGHSLGEYVAACLANVFTLEDALRIVATRGRLLAALPAGAMTSVPLNAQELEPFLRAGCDLGAINGERLCVLSGPLAAIESAERALLEQQITPRRLHIAIASHSAMTEPLLGELERVIATARLQAPQRAFISSVTGKPITSAQATSPAYWAQHLRSTVRFADGLNELFGKAGRVVLEVGPGEALSALARQHPLASAAIGIFASQTHPQQQARNEQQMAQAIAGLWCAGVDIDWNACMHDETPARVALPGYAFQRSSYWVEPATSGADTNAGTKLLKATENAVNKGPFYVPSWQRYVPRPETAAIDEAGTTGTAVIFGNGAQIAQPLLDRLRAQGNAIVHVEAGANFERVTSRHFKIRPAERNDYEALLGEIESESAVEAVYHLWSTSDATSATDTALEQGFFSILALAQALENSAHSDAAKRTLLVAASNSEDITGTEPLIPANATLFPLCKVIGQEFPHIDCRFVDVVAPQSPTAQFQLAQQLQQEMHLARACDTAVAYRGPHRWIKTFEPFQPDGQFIARLRREGVYLITGGLGGVGLALAQHLAEHWQARLILVGRTPLPDRSQWQRLVDDQDQPASLRQKLQQLLALESVGAQVMTAAVNVADAAQMQALIAQAQAHFGAIHGVVHAAGHAENGMLATRSRESVERIFAAKLAGTRLLIELLEQTPLDFMLLCSSISSITGGLGKGDYAAANAYLDAIAVVAGRRTAYPVFSVDWDAWRDLGMAAGMNLPDGIGWNGPEAAQVFERIVNGAAVSQLVISTTDLQLRLGDIDAGMLDVLAFLPITASQKRNHPRPILQTPYVAPDGDLQETVAALWSEMLGIAAIGVNDNLFELGGDSLLAIQMLARIQQLFGVELHPATFFKAPTIDDLAMLIEIRLIEEIEQAESHVTTADRTPVTA